jgi:hypothetical protein
MQINIGRNGQQLGTFNEEEVREGLQSGKFLPTDLGWHEGQADWQPLSSLAVIGAVALPMSSPPAPGMAPQVMHPMGAAPRNSNLALASMICGIAAIPLDFCCYLGVPCGIAAIICGHMAISEIKKSPTPIEGAGMAKTGLICGYVALALVVALIVLAILMGIGAPMLEEMSKNK